MIILLPHTLHHLQYFVHKFLCRIFMQQFLLFWVGRKFLNSIIVVYYGTVPINTCLVPVTVFNIMHAYNNRSISG